MIALHNDRRLFDHMTIETFQTCWNKYYFKYVLGYGQQPSKAMLFGQIFHESLQLWYRTKSIEEAETHFLKTVDELGDNFFDKPIYTPSVALNRLREYAKVHQNDFDCTDTELELFIPLSTPQGHEVAYVTHIDCIGIYHNTKTFLEFKTTGLSYSLDYTQLLQLKGYSYALSTAGLADFGLVDVIILRNVSEPFHRYPLIWSREQIKSFKDSLARIIDEIYVKEQNAPFLIPSLHCYQFNHFCQYMPICQTLTQVNTDVNLIKPILEKFFIKSNPYCCIRAEHQLMEHDICLIM